MSDLGRRLQVLADTLNSPAWEDVGERGNPIRSALAASDEVLHELLDKVHVARLMSSMSGLLPALNNLRAALSERKKP